MMTKILNETRQYGSFFPRKRLKRESFKLTVPPGELFHSCRLTILDTHYGGTAKLETTPQKGKRAGAKSLSPGRAKGQQTSNTSSGPSPDRPTHDGHSSGDQADDRLFAQP
jgi:hypothetical protein